MAPKEKGKEFWARKWSECELKVLASVFTVDQTNFALTLETLALKKSVNVIIFESIIVK